MAMADIFVILSNVQFEKNNYQNRYKLYDWVTKSVKSGTELIKDKQYTDGSSLLDINMQWINTIKNTLGIETAIAMDFPTELTGTQRIVEICKHFGGTTYITNPEATKKYLNADLMKANGIALQACVVPPHLQVHTFIAFEKWGITGTASQLPHMNEVPIMNIDSEHIMAGRE